MRSLQIVLLMCAGFAARSRANDAMDAVRNAKKDWPAGRQTASVKDAELKCRYTVDSTAKESGSTRHERAEHEVSLELSPKDGGLRGKKDLEVPVEDEKLTLRAEPGSESSRLRVELTLSKRDGRSLAHDATDAPLKKSEFDLKIERHESSSGVEARCTLVP